MEWTEIIGLSAGVSILLSFLFNKEIPIRIVNIIGVTLFIVYGILINAVSIWAVNIVLAIIHIYKLIKAYIRYKNSTKKIVYNYQNKRMVIREDSKNK